MSVLSLLLSLLLKIKQNYISGLRQNHRISKKQSNFLLLLFFKTTPSVMTLSSILRAFRPDLFNKTFYNDENVVQLCTI